MKLRRIVFKGVRGVADCAFDLTDPTTGEPHSIVFVTGPSASGKTRFLEGIFAAKELIAPYAARPAAAPWVRPGEPAAKISLTWHLTPEEQGYGALGQATADTESIFSSAYFPPPEDDGIVSVLGRYEHGHTTGKMEYFPANRTIQLSGISAGLSAFEQKPMRPTADPRKFASVVRVVHELSSGGPTADYFAALLERLSPTVRFEAATSTDAFPRCFTGEHGPRSVRELSSSEADAVLIAGISVLVGLSRSVVLIDLPDLYTDPSFIPYLAAGLVSLGEDVQVIAATRAPQAFGAVKPNQVLTLGGVR